MSAATPVTGGAQRWPMVDRHGQRLHVGDRIRFQYCCTRIEETTVDCAHYDYCCIGSANFHLNFETGILEGKFTHRDWEHGHETWVEILRSETKETKEGTMNANDNTAKANR